MISATDKTRTSYFLVPVLGFKSKHLREAGFINGYCFIKDPDKKSMKDCIYLLFKPSDQTKLGELIEEYKDNIIDEIDYDKGYTALVCPFPAKYINDKNLFWKGKFSKMSKSYRENLNMIDNKFALSAIKKSKALKEQVEEAIGEELPYDSEVISSPLEEIETLNIQIFLID